MGGAEELLVAESDETIGGILTASLTGLGHRVVWRRAGPEALAEAARVPFALVLLDLELASPGDGPRLCRRLRAALPDAVLVALSVRAEEMDVVLVLDAGADDFLAKPVPLRRVLARVCAHLRPPAPASPGTPPVVLGDLVLDPVCRVARVGGSRLGLRAKEFDLLARLAAAPGVTVGRDALIADVWDPRWHGPTVALDACVAALRRRLAGVGPGRDLPRLVTVRGQGLRLELASSPRLPG